MSAIRIVSQKPVFNGKRFEVRKVELDFGSGKRRVHYDVKRNPTACILPLTEFYEVYLISQYRYLYKKNILELIAGFVGHGETPLAAAKRELKEETGLKATQWELIAKIELAASVIKGTDYIFLAKDLEEEPSSPREGEEITVVKMPLSEAVGKVINGEINTAETIIGIFLLYRLKREKRL